ncbi:hypothetical protein Tco_1277509 [Tanacetum coccineum]
MISIFTNPCSPSLQQPHRKVVDDVGEDEDFKGGSWVSAVEFVNANGGGIVNGCLGDIENYLKNGKLKQVVAIIKSCTPNALGDLIVTLKDLLGVALVLQMLMEITVCKSYPMLSNEHDLTLESQIANAKWHEHLNGNAVK